MDKIGICGGGLIGASWALGFSSNKYKVFVYDNSKKVREEFLNTVKSLYKDLSILKDISFNEIKSNIVICNSIEEICKDATLIQESISSFRKQSTQGSASHPTQASQFRE